VSGLNSWSSQRRKVAAPHGQEAGTDLRPVEQVRTPIGAVEKQPIPAMAAQIHSELIQVRWALAAPSLQQEVFALRACSARIRRPVRGTDLYLLMTS